MGGSLVSTDFDLSTARVVVAGLGITGRAVASALADRARHVLTVDASAPEADVANPDDVDFAEVDLIVTSPGWAPSHPLLARGSDEGVPIWSEIELAWHLRVDRRGPGLSGPAPWLAVTGTNGKTTTVGMLTSILRAGGHSVAEVGNVGMPVVLAALDPDVEVLAVELSSFQLRFTHSMSAHAAAALNLAPDHLDWHGSFASYARDKGRIFDRVSDACIYNVADSATRAMVERADVVEGARAVGFTLGAPGRSELGVVDGIVCDRAFHSQADAHSRHQVAEELCTLEDLAHLAGPSGHVAAHTIANALAAAALARSFGVSAHAVRTGLAGFTGGGHRVELVQAIASRVDSDPHDDEHPGVAYIDDSKAANPHAAAAALGGFEVGSVVWIAGGLTKGTTFDDLVSARADRLRAVVLIGVDQGDLHHALTRHAPQVPVLSIDPGDTGTVMTRAVHAAADLAHSGDTVLLAPACASMDQFASYAARGDAFAAAARALAAGE